MGGLMAFDLDLIHLWPTKTGNFSLLHSTGSTFYFLAFTLIIRGKHRKTSKKNRRAEILQQAVNEIFFFDRHQSRSSGGSHTRNRRHRHPFQYIRAKAPTTADSQLSFPVESGGSIWYLRSHISDLRSAFWRVCLPYLIGVGRLVGRLVGRVK